LRFDTLKLAKSLERAGLTREQAEIIVDALRESQTDQTAVKSEFAVLTAATLEAEIDRFRTELKWWIVGTAIAAQVISHLWR
jgi:hypothetical protein